VAKRRIDMKILHFPKNSVSDKVVLAKSDVSGLTAFTVAAWFQIKVGSSENSIFQYVVNIAGDYNEIGIFADTSDGIAVAVNDVWSV